jgi:hypothetical protein
MPKNWNEVNIESGKVWDKTKEKVITGLLVEKKTGVGPNESHLYVLEVAGENVSIWGSTVLDNKMSTAKVGEEVMIEYVGKTKNPKTNREYHDYKVFTREVPFTEVDGTQDDEEDEVDVDDIPFD